MSGEAVADPAPIPVLKAPPKHCPNCGCRVLGPSTAGAHKGVAMHYIPARGEYRAVYAAEYGTLPPVADDHLLFYCPPCGHAVQVIPVSQQGWWARKRTRDLTVLF